MCGILGFFNIKSEDSAIEKSDFSLMLDKLKRRGPDNQTIVRIPALNGFLGHARLSIQDLSEVANQPMKSNNNYLVFNGEIYNHNELRSKLTEYEIDWRSTSDTETALHFIERLGINEFLKQASGMFALGYLDLRAKRIFLARDISGEKPLCYGTVETSRGTKFYFGSTLDPIFSYPNVEVSLNKDARDKYFQYNYVPAPDTIIEGIMKVKPGHYIEIDLSTYSYSENIKYFEPFERLEEPVTQDSIKLAVEESVVEQLISDVPLGTFLSGGVDSSLITAIAARHMKIKTFTIGFNEPSYNEAPYAKEIAKYLDTEHEEYYLSKSEILDAVSNLTSAYDEPFADSSQLPTLLLTKYASESLTVALSGDGGDELFAGYNRYIYANKIERSLRSYPMKQLIKMADQLPGVILDVFGNQILHIKHLGNKVKKLNSITNVSDVYNEIVSNSADHISKYYASQEFLSYDGINGYCKNDFQTYLPDDILVKVDRAAMYNSLETRAPFLNRKLVNLAFNLSLSDKIDGRNSKIPLKKMLSDYIPSKLINRPKMGFGIPVEKWLRTDLFDWANSLIFDSRFDNRDDVPIESFRKEWDDFINFNKSSYPVIWNALMFLGWYKERFF